jgi:hypothetical protein
MQATEAYIGSKQRLDIRIRGTSTLKMDDWTSVCFRSGLIS